MLSQAQLKKNPYHLDVGSPHYLVQVGDKSPLIFTTSISYCVGIGFICKANHKVRKTAIYHSYGEHASFKKIQIFKAFKEPDEPGMISKPDNLIRAIKDFMEDVGAQETVTVVIHVNRAESDSYATEENPEKSYNFTSVRAMVKKVCKYMGHKVNCNFRYIQGGGIFCMMSNGKYYSPTCHEDFEETAQEVGRFIYKEIIAAKRFSLVFGCKIQLLDGTTRRGTKSDDDIVKEITKADQGKISWVNACKNIYDIVRAASVQKKCIGLFRVDQLSASEKKAYLHLQHILEYFVQPFQIIKKYGNNSKAYVPAI